MSYTLYTSENNPRSTAICAVAKANGLDLKVENIDSANLPADYLKIHGLGKWPALVCPDGYKLIECIAIAIYVTSQNEKTTLLGKTKQDYASILKWMSYFNSEVLVKLGGWMNPLRGLEPYNKKSVDEHQKATLKAIDVVEEHLTHNTYLVGERITLADLFATGIIARGFDFFFDKKWRAEHPAVARWYETVYNQDIYKAVATEFKLLDTPALTNQAPKKTGEPKAEKAKAAPKAAAAAEEEDDTPKEPKAKHPCDLLPKSSFALDDWKRYYSNHDEAESLKWFWENVPLSEYSVWKVKYKYNDELTQVFMSSNLIGGFFARLEGSRKYLFGCLSVYGESNNSVIEGAMVGRGDDHAAIFNVAPDWESYDFEKLDPASEEHKAYVAAQWTWDKPVVVDGKEYPHAQGKVFK